MCLSPLRDKSPVLFPIQITPIHQRLPKAQSQGIASSEEPSPLPVPSGPPPASQGCWYLCDQLQVIHIVLLCDNEFVDVALPLPLSRGQHI